MLHQARHRAAPAGDAMRWSEPTLISTAYGFEQHTHARQAQRFLDTVDGQPLPPER